MLIEMHDTCKEHVNTLTPDAMHLESGVDLQQLLLYDWKLNDVNTNTNTAKAIAMQPLYSCIIVTDTETRASCILSSSSGRTQFSVTLYASTKNATH
jgi:hypothetical protein